MVWTSQSSMRGLGGNLNRVDDYCILNNGLSATKRSSMIVIDGLT